MTVNTWRIARESTEWVGPIAVAVTKRDGTAGTPNVKLAVLPRGQRPADADFADPDLDPDGTGALGVMQHPVTAYVALGIWAKDIDDPEIPVLEPSDVGWITRT